MKNRKLAAIDIGTNTFRLLIAEVCHHPLQNTYSINEIHSERVITRLGEGIHDGRNLSREAMDRSIKALRKFCQAIAFKDVYKVSAIATSALREAENSDYFLGEVKKVTELPIEIISGQREAEVTAAGMFLDMTVPEKAFMIDIGGGSTELIYAIKGSPERVRSLNTGVVHLAGKYMSSDPPDRENLDRMEQEILRSIHGSYQSFRDYFSNDTVMIGTAGTVTSLAAMSQNLREFDHRKIHNFLLPIHAVKNIFTTISSLSSKERAEHIPFELSRLDIIVPGTLILSTLMETFGFAEIRVSNYGLREGILIELFKGLK